MPVRLSGVLDWSGGLLADRRLEEEWEQAYAAPPPWRRVVHRVGSRVRVALDDCGDSSLSRCLAVGGQAGVGVAGTIRLDRRDELRAELGVYSAAARLAGAGFLRVPPPPLRPTSGCDRIFDLRRGRPGLAGGRPYARPGNN